MRQTNEPRVMGSNPRLALSQWMDLGKSYNYSTTSLYQRSKQWYCEGRMAYVEWSVLCTSEQPGCMLPRSGDGYRCEQAQWSVNRFNDLGVKCEVDRAVSLNVDYKSSPVCLLVSYVKVKVIVIVCMYIQWNTLFCWLHTLYSQSIGPVHTCNRSLRTELIILHKLPTYPHWHLCLLILHCRT